MGQDYQSKHLGPTFHLVHTLDPVNTPTIRATSIIQRCIPRISLHTLPTYLFDRDHVPTLASTYDTGHTSSSRYTETITQRPEGSYCPKTRGSTLETCTLYQTTRIRDRDANPTVAISSNVCATCPYRSRTGRPTTDRPPPTPNPYTSYPSPPNPQGQPT